MATRVAPGCTDLYDADFYAWALEQATLLRAGRMEELDLENLIEEVEDLAGGLKRSVPSRVRTIVAHLLKLQHAPAGDRRIGWREGVRAQRGDLRDELTPTLRREIEAELADLYARARLHAAESLRDRGEHAAADALPAACPYPLDRITGDWLP